MIRRFILPILVTTALTSVAGAQEAPKGWVAAVASGTAPEGSHSMEGYVPRRFCGLVVPMKVQRDGVLKDASARVSCGGR